MHNIECGASAWEIMPIHRTTHHEVGPEDGLPTWLVEVVVSQPTARQALIGLNHEILKQFESLTRSRPPCHRLEHPAEQTEWVLNTVP